MIVRHCVVWFVVAGGLLGSAGATQAASGEYEQVRKIAMRDPRVRDAFNRAYERLDAKIVDLDPALAGYVRRNPSGQAEPARYQTTEERHPAPAPEASRPRVRPSLPPPPVVAPHGGRTHVVAPGETLSSIATRYGVTVAALERVNHIQDARKLRAGQTLSLP